MEKYEGVRGGAVVAFEAVPERKMELGFMRTRRGQ